MRNRFMALAAAAALITSSLAAKADPIVLGYSASTAFSTAFVAADQGLFRKHGVEVELKLVPNSSTTPAALVAGSLQVATPTAPVTLQAVEQGLDLVVVAGGGYYVKGMEDVAVMVRPDSTIASAKDFEGKRVATAGLNAFLHVLFRKWMEDNGGDYRKVRFTETPFAQQIDVLKNGQVDAILAVQPFMGRALDEKIGKVVSFYISDLEGETLSGWFVASGDWVRKNPKDVAAFRAAMKEATDLMNKDPSVVTKANLVYIPFPAAVQAKFSKGNYRYEVLPAALETWNKICMDQNMLKQPIPYDKIIMKP